MEVASSKFSSGLWLTIVIGLISIVVAAVMRLLPVNRHYQPLK